MYPSRQVGNPHQRHQNTQLAVIDGGQQQQARTVQGHKQATLQHGQHVAVGGGHGQQQQTASRVANLATVNNLSARDHR